MALFGLRNAHVYTERTLALKTRAEARLVCNTQNITMSECEDLTNTWKGGGKWRNCSSSDGDYACAPPSREKPSPNQRTSPRDWPIMFYLPLWVIHPPSVRRDSSLPRLLDGRGCTLTAHSYAVYFHCISISTWLNQARTTLLITQEERTRRYLG